jgi:hypothetical protein
MEPIKLAITQESQKLGGLVKFQQVIINHLP